MIGSVESSASDLYGISALDTSSLRLNIIYFDSPTLLVLDCSRYSGYPSGLLFKSDIISE